LTESVARLGSAVVGRTWFCPGDAPTVGGPKDASVEALLALGPDLVLASRAENDRATIEAVARSRTVWLCDPLPEDAPAVWRELGEMLGRASEGRQMATATERALDAARASREQLGPGPVFVCWVWRDPWMAAGRDTWIAAILESAGFRNAVSKNGYPRVEPRSVAADLHLLPSEPYAFTDADTEALGGGDALATPGWFRLAEGALAALVPGEPLIWYPSHVVEGILFARDLRTLVSSP
jgi:ABC-type hemin transport system substrate-binding protein